MAGHYHAADFERLNKRRALRGRLVTRTALRIGSGGANALDGADLPVLKDGEGAPFIPGGSLKGALRSTLEALVRGAEHRDSGIWTCNPLEESHATCGYHEGGRRGSADVSNHCALCCLFGSRLVASHVRICDAMLIRSDEERRMRQVPIEIRDGVAIDRDTKKVSGQAKYDFEVVAPGAEFALEVYIENTDNALMGLLTIGFDQLRDGFTALGGFTSRGLGRVDLIWESLTEVTALELLTNQGSRILKGSALEQALDDWRQTLALRIQGGA